MGFYMIFSYIFNTELQIAHKVHNQLFHRRSLDFTNKNRLFTSFQSLMRIPTKYLAPFSAATGLRQARNSVTSSTLELHLELHEQRLYC